jgi:formylglycine-generating enzyme required for sulfatase activity
MAKQNFIKRIISSPLVQTFLIYLSGGWIALEMSDYFIRKYDLNEKISDFLSIILLIGLPIAIFLAWYLSREKIEKKKVVPDTASDKKPPGLFRYMKKRPWFSIPVLVVIVLLMLTGVRYIHLQRKIKWATEEALPQMEMCLHDWNIRSAFQMRQKVKKYIPDDPEFLSLDSEITTSFTVLTDPEGVEVFYKEYSDVEGEWEFLGITPIERIDMPNRTMYRWKLEKMGYEVVYAVLPTNNDTLSRIMHETGKIPDGMVYVEGISEQTARDYLAKDKYGFFIDKYEVTNKQFKEFIDRRGYQNRDFWQNEFILNSETISFEEAMDHFTDATGRPGPSTWEAGDFPDGRDDYPVNGISWYEAAAYAVYAGKSLPTKNHWRSAAGLEMGSFGMFYGSCLIPLSNMKGTGPDPVGSNEGLNCFGTYDMFGNVREWCWNESPAGKIIQGGAWNDVSYMSWRESHLPAFNRSAKNGFRCVYYLDKERIPKEAFLPIETEQEVDYRLEEPVSKIEFQIYSRQFLYDKKELNSKLENRVETPTDWILEKVSFDAAYEKDRMIAYLFLPKESVPPFQTIIYFPGIGALSSTSIIERDFQNLNYIIKNGRAVMYPIYIGTYERKDNSCYPVPAGQSHQFSECTVKSIKDFSRSIDYLETREEIDTARLAFLGDSWGGYMGTIIPAVEDRIKLSILLRGGWGRGRDYHPKLTASII